MGSVAYFVVICEQGPRWDATRAMRDQADWEAHATFMDSLVDAGFVVLGGPIAEESTHRARLIVRADSQSSVRARLAADPWARSGVLQVATIEQWEVLLGNGDP
jgi:uncharacterized protein YciI